MIDPFKNYGIPFDNTIKKKVICISVTKKVISDPDHNIDKCIKGFWTLNGSRAIRAEYVFAVVYGCIVSVYKPTEWFQSKDNERKKKWRFDGETIFDTPFLGLSVQSLVGTMKNPIYYLNM